MISKTWVFFNLQIGTFIYVLLITVVQRASTLPDEVMSEHGRRQMSFNAEDSDSVSDDSESSTTNPNPLLVGILTVSDRCSQSKAEDLSGNLLAIYVSDLDWKVAEKKCIPDDQTAISSTLIDWCDNMKLDLILTTGGTGLAERDVTPEATKDILDKETSGITTALMMESLKITPMAMLSRLISGIRKRTLVINFPGSPKACSQCINVIKPIIKHAIDVLRGHPEGNVLHEAMTRLESKVNISQVARRNRQSPYEIISADEALKRILNLKYTPLTISKKLKDAVGFVVAEDIHAKEPFPPFRASIKDGYAVIAEDGVGTRKVISSRLAGFEESSDNSLKPGECMRITTGAPIPKGSDSVVQVEDTRLVSEDDSGATETVVEIIKLPSMGQDIREIGSDIKEGETLLQSGTILTPDALGVLATAGIGEVLVIKKPRVAVLSTGNELQPPDEILKPGKIRDCNKTAVISLLEQNGFETYDSGIVSDDPNNILNVIYNTLKRVDVLITTGGVSMGERDLIADVLMQDMNAEMLFGRIKMKPGKPTKVFVLRTEDGPKYVFALPGNPVSAVVTCRLFVFPALRAMSGWRKPLPMLFKVKIPVDIKLDERNEYARAFLIWNEGDIVPTASLTGNQISSRLMSMVEADCLLHLPGATESMRVLSAGTLVDAQLINPNLMK